MFFTDEFSGGDSKVSGDHGRRAHRSQGQQLPHHDHKHTTSPSSQTRKTGWVDSKSASPKRATEGWVDPVEHPKSSKRTEQGHGGSWEEINKERKTQGQRDHYSSSPRDNSHREEDSAGPLRNMEEPQNPRHPVGQQPSVPYGKGKEWKYKEEDAAYWQDRGTADSGDKGRSTTERHDNTRRDEPEVAAHKSHSQMHREKVRPDVESGGLNQRSGKEKEYWESRHHGTTDELNRKEPRGSSSSIQESSCNGTATINRKAPISPGPWKVPSSSKIQSHMDHTFADV